MEAGGRGLAARVLLAACFPPGVEEHSSPLAEKGNQGGEGPSQGHQQESEENASGLSSCGKRECWVSAGECCTLLSASGSELVLSSPLFWMRR